MRARSMRTAIALTAVVAALAAPACNRKKNDGTCKIDIDCQPGFDCKNAVCVKRPPPPWEQQQAKAPPPAPTSRPAAPAAAAPAATPAPAEDPASAAAGTASKPAATTPAPGAPSPAATPPAPPQPRRRTVQDSRYFPPDT